MQSRPTPFNPAGSVCLFLGLPAELRLRIYEYLLPSGCIFFVAPVTADVAPWNRRLVAITKIGASSDCTQQCGAASLLSLNKQIHAEIYPILYGENFFYFLLTAERTFSTSFALAAEDRVEAWTRCFRVRHSGLWPLTPDTVGYVKRATLLITPSSRKSWPDFDGCSRRIEAAVTALAAHRELRSLSIVFLPQPLGGRLKPRCSDGLFEHSLDLQPFYHGGVHSISQLVRPADVRQYMLEGFVRLHGFKNVSISGAVAPSFAEKLREILVGDKPATLELSPLYGVTETVVARRKDGGTKRRKVKKPVMKYWEPKYVWDDREPAESLEAQ